MHRHALVSGSLLAALVLAAAHPAQAQEPSGSVPPAAPSAGPPAGYVPPGRPMPYPAAGPRDGYAAPAYPGAYPPSAVAPNGEYVAPLSQTTQPAYVPQSVALSGPRFIKDWRDGDPIPYGYHREERVRKGMVITGPILFGVPYLYGTLLASASHDIDHDEFTALYIPVLGPFIQMSKTDSATGREILAIDGVLQATGAFLFIYGLAVPRAILVRNDLGSISLAPVRMGQDGRGNGLALFGTF